MKIGVFDSGIGGERVANLLQLELPESQIISLSDKDNLPYGNKTTEQLMKLVIPKIISLEKQGCSLIIIACNTVTTNIIKEIREAVGVPIVGFEPMLKPAAKITKTKNIVVCATKRTLSSQRYLELKTTYGLGLNIIEPDCSDWADLIEKNMINTKHIQEIIKLTKHSNADTLVLGCTHYHWIEQIIFDSLGGKVAILQPEEAIIRRIKFLIRQQLSRKS